MMALFRLPLIRSISVALVLQLILPVIAFDVRDGSPANNTDDPAYSTFVFEPEAGPGNLTFSLTAVEENNDLYMHLFAPADFQWVGVGIGRRMKDALMFIVYHDSTGKNVTFSPRTATGNSEPTYHSSIDCSVNGSASGIVTNATDDDQKYYSVNAHCRNVTTLAKLDLTSETAPFIFAIGPTDYSLESSHKAAGIRFHDAHGGFTMDMTQATQHTAEGAGTTFGNGTVKGSQKSTSIRVDDGGYGTQAHAVLMCGAFLFFFPLGFLFLRILGRVKLHASIQGLGLAVVLVGMGLGLWIGRLYNKSKDVKSGHQILGLIIVSFLVVQFLLGYFHHRIYLRTHVPTLFGKIHRYAGPVLLGLGLVNGAVGFRFADAQRHNIFYLVIVLVMVVLVSFAVWTKAKRDKRKAMAGVGFTGGAPPPYSVQTPASGLAPGGSSGRHEHSANSSRTDIALGDMGYYGGAQPTQPRQMV